MKAEEIKRFERILDTEKAYRALRADRPKIPWYNVNDALRDMLGFNPMLSRDEMKTLDDLGFFPSLQDFSEYRAMFKDMS